jgi:hypothetical protein
LEQSIQDCEGHVKGVLRFPKLHGIQQLGVLPGLFTQ